MTVSQHRHNNHRVRCLWVILLMGCWWWSVVEAVAYTTNKREHKRPAFKVASSPPTGVSQGKEAIGSTAISTASPTSTSTTKGVPADVAATMAAATKPSGTVMSSTSAPGGSSVSLSFAPGSVYHHGASTTTSFPQHQQQYHQYHPYSGHELVQQSYSPNYLAASTVMDSDDEELIGVGVVVISCLLSLIIGFGLGYGL